MFDFFLVLKIILMLFIWVGIFLCSFLLLKARNIYITLKDLDKLFQLKTRDINNNFIPALNEISVHNKNLQMLIGIRRLNFISLFILIIPFLAERSRVIKGFKTGYDLTKKLFN